MRDTIEMAREAGLLTWLKPPEDVIERFKSFEALVRNDYSNKHAQLWLKRIDEAVKAEREACAKLCDEARAARLAEQIRARGETK
jgi:regulator of protease activity HflC (stomatin/prohibitin superfamily)